MITELFYPFRLGGYSLWDPPRSMSGPRPGWSVVSQDWIQPRFCLSLSLIAVVLAEHDDTYYSPNPQETEAASQDHVVRP